MKTNVDRVVYIARKLNEYSRARYDYCLRRTDRQPPKTRYARLMAYKLAVKARIDAERNSQHP
jgi:hypothetical protein